MPRAGASWDPDAERFPQLAKHLGVDRARIGTAEQDGAERKGIALYHVQLAEHTTADGAR